MSRLRVLVAWLVLAALPLQGFAAASMLFCGAGARLAAGHGQAAHGHAAGHDASALHHGGHGHGAHQHADPGAGPDMSGQIAKADPGHSCPVCAACNLAAIAPAGAGIQPAVPPPADLPQAAVRVTERALPLPDRPPRA